MLINNDVCCYETYCRYPDNGTVTQFDDKRYNILFIFLFQQSQLLYITSSVTTYYADHSKWRVWLSNDIPQAKADNFSHFIPFQACLSYLAFFQMLIPYDVPRSRSDHPSKLESLHDYLYECFGMLIFVGMPRQGGILQCAKVILVKSMVNWNDGENWLVGKWKKKMYGTIMRHITSAFLYQSQSDFQFHSVNAALSKLQQGVSFLDQRE